MRRVAAALALASLVLTAPQAEASRARSLVLGSGSGLMMYPLAGPSGAESGFLTLGNGSLYYEDSYNFFINPAAINDERNWVLIEKSTDTSATAQGGFIMSALLFKLGIYVNRPGSTQRILGASSYAPALNYAAGTVIRPIELFIGADMGVKWALGFSYGAATGAAVSGTNVGITAGAQIAFLEPFFGMTVYGQDSGSSASGTNHASIRGGVKAQLEDWAPYFAFVNSTNTVASTGARESELVIGGGVGHSTKLTETLRLNTAISFWNASAGTDPSGTVASRQGVPLELSAEGDFLTWLTLRAGLIFHLWDRASLGSASAPPAAYTNPNSMARGAMGASFHFGKLHMDWAIGGLLGAAPGMVQSPNFDFSNGLFAAAGMTFQW